MGQKEEKCICLGLGEAGIKPEQNMQEIWRRNKMCSYLQPGADVWERSKRRDADCSAVSQEALPKPLESLKVQVMYQSSSASH